MSEPIRARAGRDLPGSTPDYGHGSSVEADPEAAGPRASHARQRRYGAPLMAAALARGGLMSFELHGRCMWPALRPGDRVFVRSAAAGAGIGEIAISSDGSHTVAHRVVALGRGPDGAPQVICRGDASLLPDAAVRVRDLIGLVAAVERSGRPIALTSRASLVSRALAHTRPALRWLRTRLARALGQARREPSRTA